jgi:hypothetical protein
MNEEKKIKQPTHKIVQRLLIIGTSSKATDPFCVNNYFILIQPVMFRKLLYANIRPMNEVKTEARLIKRIRDLHNKRTHTHTHEHVRSAL